MAEQDAAERHSPVAPRALQRAGERVFGGPETSWSAKSRFGPPGRLARRIVRRALRPFEHRQHEVDAALFEAIREAAGIQADPTNALQLAQPLIGREIDDAPTPIGSFWVDRNDITIAPSLRENAAFQWEVAKLIQERVRPAMTFVDVGANIGYFSVLASRLVGDRGRVISVEPDPANLQLLRANLWRNRCFNAQVVPIAAWSEATHMSLVTMPDGGGATEVSGDYSPYVDDPRVSEDAIGTHLVPCGKLDDLITPPVGFLKVDAQFTDHLVIRGAEVTISASPNITVIVEFGREELRRRGEKPEEILAYYRALGFEILCLSEAGEVDLLDDEAILTIEDRPYLDLVLQRPGRA